MKKKLCILTGTRAEYGILKPLIDLVLKDQELELQLIVTGMHLSDQYGKTVDQIEKDGVPITKKIDILLSSRTPVSVIKTIGIASINFADAFEELKPDFLILLGDRFELLPAAQAALILHIPIVHIHGGEITEGAIDDSIRHSITKMSYLHFTSTEDHRKRVIQLGEEPHRVFNVGAPGLDNIVQLKLLSRKELEESLGIKFKSKLFLVTYHPVTLSKEETEKETNALMTALSKFSDCSIVITMPNSDPHSSFIVSKIEDFAKSNLNAHIYTSLGQLRYLSALKEADVVIGNSSSGLIEAPLLQTPTINIGKRQNGRTSGDTVIHTEGEVKSIEESILKSLSDEFKTLCKQGISPYGTGDTSKKIIETIKKYDLGQFPIKKFYDLNF